MAAGALSVPTHILPGCDGLTTPLGMAAHTGQRPDGSRMLGLRVATIAPASAAASSGVCENDVIVAINGQPVVGDDYDVCTMADMVMLSSCVPGLQPPTR